MLSLSCNVLGVGLFSNASSIEEQANLQKDTFKLNGLSLKVNKQTKSDCKTWHNSWNISFGNLLVKLFLKIAHQLQILPKQTSLPNSLKNPGEEKCGKG